MQELTREYEYKQRLHKGEREVQARVGALEAQKQGSRMIRPFMPLQHRQFYEECLEFIFIGSLDAGGRLWASVLPGLPGFIKSPSDTTLQIRAPVSPSDPLHESLKPGAPVGLLGIELATRRRNRANGKITQVHDQGRGGFDFKVDVSFGNCPKYIQTRKVDYVANAKEKLGQAFKVESFNVLTPEVRAYIDRSDTFFVSSCFLENTDNPSHGVDVSHRGVEPGAILFRDDHTLVWPDYLGNFLFNTLGNFVKDPRCGLLFLDFGPEGDILQLTGKAHIEWDKREVPGAQRSVIFTLEEARIVRHALSMLRTSFLDKSPFLPAAKMREGIDFSTGLSGYPVRVAAIEQETHDTKTFVVTANVAIASLQKPGQHATFLMEIGEEMVSRSWTVSSAPRSSAEYDIAITVKKLPGGKASTWLHENVTVGSKFRLVSISGSFHLPGLSDKGPGKLLFIAGGVGITPLMSMLRSLVHYYAASDRRLIDVALLYSVRSLDDLVFGQELFLLQSVLPQFKLHINVTRPSSSLAAQKQASGDEALFGFLVGRLTADVIKELVPDFSTRAAYICGPEAFMVSVVAALKDELQSPAPVHTESFSY